MHGQPDQEPWWHAGHHRGVHRRACRFSGCRRRAAHGAGRRPRCRRRALRDSQTHVPRYGPQHAASVLLEQGSTLRSLQSAHKLASMQACSWRHKWWARRSRAGVCWPLWRRAAALQHRHRTVILMSQVQPSTTLLNHVLTCPQCMIGHITMPNRMGACLHRIAQLHHHTTSGQPSRHAGVLQGCAGGLASWLVHHTNTRCPGHCFMGKAGFDAGARLCGWRAIAYRKAPVEGAFKHGTCFLQALQQGMVTRWCLLMARSLTAALQSCPRMGRCVRRTLYIARAAHTGRTGLLLLKGHCPRLLRHMLMACRMLIVSYVHAGHRMAAAGAALLLKQQD